MRVHITIEIGHLDRLGCPRSASTRLLLAPGSDGALHQGLFCMATDRHAQQPTGHGRAKKSTTDWETAPIGSARSAPLPQQINAACNSEHNTVWCKPMGVSVCKDGTHATNAARAFLLG